MTLTPNTQITQANVGLLKAGDRVKVTNACSFLKSEGYPNGSLVTVRSVGGEYIDIAEIPYPQSTYAHRFTYIGPDLGDGWIGWGGGPNPVPGMRVDVETRGTGIWSDWLSDQWGTSWLPEEHEDPDCADAIVAFRPALSPPAEGEGRGDDYEGPDAGMHDTEIDDRDDDDPTPAPVDWERVGPKLVEALERIAADGEPYRNGYCQTDIAVDPALTAQEAQDVARAALAAAQPEDRT